MTHVLVWIPLVAVAVVGAVLLGSPKDRIPPWEWALSIVGAGAALYLAEGRVDGEILREPRGTAGFGYDPVFLYPPAGQTFAELEADAKNRISHRARARAEALCAAMRRERVSRPLRNTQALNGLMVGPAVRRKP